MNGLISSIQRLSTHDGPGIRTTVFLKGCNMHCPWCHNPESMTGGVSIGVTRKKCRGCGRCLMLCPSGSLSMVNGKISLDQKTCVKCLLCTEECFSAVFTVAGKQYSPRKLAETLCRDKAYFDRSGGGVTFSGGEPFMQAEFLSLAAALLKETGIHVAVETNLSIPLGDMENWTGRIDYFMADLKMMNSAKHREWTGAGNEEVIENILTLDRSGVPFEIRTPVIKGVNDDPGEIKEIALFIKGLKNIRNYTLVPYHPLGLVKYRQLRMRLSYAEKSFYDKNRLEELRGMVFAVLED
jgi:pyruvate formate lyase activating enzyme